MPRSINQNGLALVKKYESCKLSAYQCPAGVWTIGYGHTKSVKKGDSLQNEPEALALLESDLNSIGMEVEKRVRVPLGDNQFSALVSFAFNVGIGNFTYSTLLKRLNAGGYDAVPSELAKWVKATDPNTGKKITLGGLVKRRAAEAELWLQDITDDFQNSVDMPQRVHADDDHITYIVAARNGLRLRSGAGMNCDILQVLPKDKEVFVVQEKDGWAAVDLEGDGTIDGWVLQDFLSLK